MTRETFGDRFARLVDQAGLSVHDVCSIVGWKSDSSYYKARRGDIGSMNPIGMLRLAKRLGVSPYYLVGESEPKGPRFLGSDLRAHFPDAYAQISIEIQEKADGPQITDERAEQIRSELARILSLEPIDVSANPGMSPLIRPPVASADASESRSTKDPQPATIASLAGDLAALNLRLAPVLEAFPRIQKLLPGLEAAGRQLDTQ